MAYSGEHRARQRLMTLFSLGLGLASLSHVEGAASVQELNRVSLPNTEYREFTSKATRRSYAVSVALPDSYLSDKEGRYPVIFVTDARVNFSLATSIYRLMRLANDVPELIIVGIDATDPETSAWAAIRFLNLTPTRSESREAEVSKSLGRPVRSGDGAGFARVLLAELIPDIEQRYRVTRDRTLVGHSLGGLFAANMLFVAPEAFRRMILVSPALYWDDAVMFRVEEKYASTSHVLHAQVFTAAGGLEGGPMLPNVKRFASVLEDRHYEGLVLQNHIFEDETHNSVGAPAMTRGLRVLFAKQVSPRETDPKL
jgi:uncharacterized protein